MYYKSYQHIEKIGTFETKGILVLYYKKQKL